MNVNAKILCIILAGACVSLAACSSSSSSSSSSSPATSEAELTTGPCGGLTLEQAAAIMHLAPADVKGPLHQQEITCLYRSRKNFYDQLFFSVYVEPSAMVAAKKLNNWKEGMAFLSPVKAVDGLGDEAWYFPDHRVRRLIMRKGNVILEETAPHDKASQIQIAKIVLAHIH